MTFYSLGELETILHCTRRTLLDYLKSGKLKGVKVARKWLVSQEQLQGFLDKRGKGATS